MRSFFFAFLAALLLTAMPLFAAPDDPPAVAPSSNAPAPQPIACCELPENHGLNLDAKNLYGMYGVDYDPTSEASQGISPPVLRAAMGQFPKTTKALRVFHESMRSAIEKDSHTLYDWFERMARPMNPREPIPVLEKARLMNEFFAGHCQRVFPREHKPTLSEYKRELVVMMNGYYRPHHNIDTTAMMRDALAQNANTVAGEVVRNEFRGFWQWRTPKYVGCAMLLLAGGVVLGMNLGYRDGVAPIEQRLPQVLERDQLRSPVTAPADPNSTLQQDGAKAAENFFDEQP